MSWTCNVKGTIFHANHIKLRTVGIKLAVITCLNHLLIHIYEACLTRTRESLQMKEKLNLVRKSVLKNSFFVPITNHKGGKENDNNNVNGRAEEDDCE